jgi:hypothetical protein
MSKSLVLKKFSIIVLTFFCSIIFGYGQNVGINTNTPLYKLDIRGISPDDGGTINLSNSDQTYFLRVFGGRQNEPNPFVQWKAGTSLRFGTDAFDFTELMSISHNGNVGIGTTSPNNTLQVAGTFQTASTYGSFWVHPIYPPGEGIISGTVLLASFDGLENGPQLRFNSTAAGFMDIGLNGAGNFVVEENDNTSLTVATGGNVGIGTPTPGTKLEVAGQIKITGGAPADGKVLTSDANGLASWQPVIKKAFFSNFLYFSAPFIVASGVEVPINYSSTRWNNNMSYSGGTITVPDSGLYHFDMTAYIANEYSNFKNIQIITYINNNYYEQHFSNVMSVDLLLNAGDQVQFRLFQSSGASITLSSFSRISGHKVY